MDSAEFRVTRRALMAGLAAACSAAAVAAQETAPLTRDRYALAFGALTDRRFAAVTALQAAAQEQAEAAKAEYDKALADGTETATAKAAYEETLAEIGIDLDAKITEIDAKYFEDLTALRARRRD